MYAGLTGGFFAIRPRRGSGGAAAEAYPGLVPTRAQLAAEAGLPLKEKQGLEIDQSLLLAHILAHPRCGTHLCHAMLLPRPETAAALACWTHRALSISGRFVSSGTAGRRIC